MNARRLLAVSAIFAVPMSAAMSAAMPADAATITSLELDRDHGRYHLVASSHLNASPASVHEVLLDYDDNAYQRISSAYKESRYLPPGEDGKPRVYTKFSGCVLFFCRTIEGVFRLDVVKPRLIRSELLPGHGNLKYSKSEWRLAPENGGTKLIYRLDVEPDFWLPDFILPAMLKGVLLRRGTDAAERVEELAKKLDEAAPGHDASNQSRQPD